MDKILERLASIVEKETAGNYSKFGKLAGIPKGTIGHYKNERAPNAEHLAKIHQAFRVNINWLLTGEGNPHLEDDDKPDLDTALLREVIEVIELVLSKHELVLDPPDKAEAVTVLYEMYLDSGKKPEERTTERMLRLVA